MARFDVYRAAGDWLLDVQADSLLYLKTRLVVPLFTAEETPRPIIDTLNPVFEFAGQSLTMMTQYAAAISALELGRPLGSLADDEYAIGRALDMLITGI